MRAAQPTHLAPSFIIALTIITEEPSYVGHCFLVSRDSSVGIQTTYGLDGRGVGVRVPVRERFFTFTRLAERLWGPHSLLSNGYRGPSPGGNVAGT